MYLLPEFRKDHFNKGNVESSRRAHNTMDKNDSLNRSYRSSQVSEVKLEFTPQRSNVPVYQSFEYTMPRALLNTELSLGTKKCRLRRPVGANNS
jgi:hypothetical protein